MDNIKKVIIPLLEYERLIEYKKAFYNNEYIIVVNQYIGSTDFTTVSGVSIDKALDAVIAENRKLKEENKRLKDRKWYQILF